MSATFTVDGFTGAGIEVSALVLENIAKFEVDVNNAMLKLTDDDGKVTNVAISDAATMSVTLASNRITAVTVAD